MEKCIKVIIVIVTVDFVIVTVVFACAWKLMFVKKICKMGNSKGG